MNFGVFCPCTHEDFAGFIENDWINCFLFDTIIKEWDHREIFTRIKEKNKTFFLGFYNDLFEREPQPIVDVGETAEIARSYLKPDWKEKIMWYRELFDSDAGQRFYDREKDIFLFFGRWCGAGSMDRARLRRIDSGIGCVSHGCRIRYVPSVRRAVCLHNGLHEEAAGNEGGLPHLADSMHHELSRRQNGKALPGSFARVVRPFNEGTDRKKRRADVLRLVGKRK